MGRDVLLAPHMQEDVWIQLAQAIDQVFASLIDTPIANIATLRDLWLYNSDAVAKIQSGQTLTPDDLNEFERDILIKAANLIGFTYHDSSLFDDLDYQRVTAFIAQHYPEKGTGNFVKFIAFCLNSVFEVETLWTQDYQTFLQEGDAGIGTPIYQGGTWYPTPNVQLWYDMEKFGGLSIATIDDFFSFLAPINLVPKGYGMKAIADMNLRIAMEAEINEFIIPGDQSVVKCSSNTSICDLAIADCAIADMVPAA